MQKHHSRRLAGVALASGLLALAPGAASAATHVNVRVEGTGKTVVKQVDVTTSKHRTVGLTGKPTCAGTSALSALDAATGGSWSGSYFDGTGYFVDTIRGQAHLGSPDSYAFWVNHKFSTVGVCEYKPKAGDELLFFVDRCTFDTKTQQCKETPVVPLALRTKAKAKAGKAFTVKVVEYSPTGKATTVKGATVKGGGLSVKTNAKGLAKLKYRKGRDVVLRASKTGTARSEYETVDVR